MTKPDLSKATPRPWRVENSKTKPSSIIGQDHGLVADVGNGRVSFDLTGDGKVNAVLIVAAINAYDEARELVERIAEKEVISEYERQVVVEKSRRVLRLMGEE